MKAVIGIDLGSTTSKAIILDEKGETIGRGITNTRSNYDVAVDVARTEALIEARFNLLARALRTLGLDDKLMTRVMSTLTQKFRLGQYIVQLENLENCIRTNLDKASLNGKHKVVSEELERVLSSMHTAASKHFRFGSVKSSFFRDLATTDYMGSAQQGDGAAFDTLANLFDKSIVEVENQGVDLSFNAHIAAPFAAVLELYKNDLEKFVQPMRTALEYVIEDALEFVGSVGTGYGRARLPFAKDQIRSEILCHGLGAHRMYPGTRTVLDIGGQDTKAIQVDAAGIVTSFQMNDRCAAGCGRYLGYIADEMKLGVHELGPLAEKSCHPTKISSTCTVFAGAELRDRLSLGEKREDILAGLHRAIMLRAMSLLARSGGIEDQFTFTGGVANNTAAVGVLKDLTLENYGELTLNISADSIYTGALGAATFALRDANGSTTEPRA